MAGIEYICSPYGAFYLINKKLTSAHKVVVYINHIPTATFVIPPLSGGFHFLGMVAVPKVPFVWEIRRTLH